MMRVETLAMANATLDKLKNILQVNRFTEDSIVAKPELVAIKIKTPNIIACLMGTG
ncbi:MAG: hypothetical protein GY796_13460 [Chloroflexi bacterium]|nr:hypothetical protein [Chloroflexota bacterium]